MSVQMPYSLQILAADPKARLMIKINHHLSYIDISRPYEDDYLRERLYPEAIRQTLEHDDYSLFHVRRDYIGLLTDFLSAYIQHKEEVTGELSYCSQHDYVRLLKDELLAQNDAWRRSLRDRLVREGRDAATLTAAVWHPRKMARYLAACTTEKEEAAVFSCFVYEN